VAKFVTIGYGDQAGYDRTHATVREAGHAHDARLLKDGVNMGVAGPPVQVRNHDAAEVTTEEGAFTSSTLPVAGFAIIEAARRLHLRAPAMVGAQGFTVSGMSERCFRALPVGPPAVRSVGRCRRGRRARCRGPSRCRRSTPRWSRR
jgi:hypothetical protein